MGCVGLKQQKWNFKGPTSPSIFVRGITKHMIFGQQMDLSQNAGVHNESSGVATTHHDSHHYMSILSCHEEVVGDKDIYNQQSDDTWVPYDIYAGWTNNQISSAKMQKLIAFHAK